MSLKYFWYYKFYENNHFLYDTIAPILRRAKLFSTKTKDGTKQQHLRTKIRNAKLTQIQKADLFHNPVRKL